MKKETHVNKQVIVSFEAVFIKVYKSERLGIQVCFFFLPYLGFKYTRSVILSSSNPFFTETNQNKPKIYI